MLPIIYLGVEPKFHNPLLPRWAVQYR